MRFRGRRARIALVALVCATWALVAVAPSAGAATGTVSGTVTRPRGAARVPEGLTSVLFCPPIPAMNAEF